MAAQVHVETGQKLLPQASPGPFPPASATEREAGVRLPVSRANRKGAMAKGMRRRIFLRKPAPVGQVKQAKLGVRLVETVHLQYGPTDLCRVRGK
jgi:hypothetical protein